MPTLLNAGLTATHIGSGLTLVPASSGAITVYEAEIIPAANTDSPYIATSDYGSSPSAAKLLAESELGVPSRRTWNVSGTGLILPAGLGITVWPNPSPTLVNSGTFTGFINTPAYPPPSPGTSITLGWTPTSGNLLTVAVSANGSLWQQYLSISGNAVGGGSWAPGPFTPPDNEQGGGFYQNQIGGTHGETTTFYGFVGSGAGQTIGISNPGAGGIFPTYSYSLGIIVREWTNVPLAFDAAGGGSASATTGNFHCYVNGLAYACFAADVVPGYPSSPWTNDGATTNGSGYHLVDTWQIPAGSGNVSATFTETSGNFFSTGAMSFGTASSGEVVSCGVTYSL